MLVVATMLGPVVASAWMVNAPVPGRAVGLGAACRSATLRMDDTVEPGFETPEPQVRPSPAVLRRTVPTHHASSCPTRAQVNLQTVAPGCSPCTIKVIGVGGGGGNTLNRMVQEGPGVGRSTFLEYVACNTDMQALSSSLADTTITLGKNTARGLGAGGVPAVGRTAAIDASAEIEALVRGVDMVRSLPPLIAARSPRPKR